MVVCCVNHCAYCHSPIGSGQRWVEWDCVLGCSGVSQIGRSWGQETGFEEISARARFTGASLPTSGLERSRFWEARAPLGANKEFPAHAAA
jgi:hypothetical protein